MCIKRYQRVFGKNRKLELSYISTIPKISRERHKIFIFMKSRRGVNSGPGPVLNIHELVQPRPLGVSGKHSDQRCARVELSDAWTVAASITPEGVGVLTHSQAVNCIMLGDFYVSFTDNCRPEKSRADDCPPLKLCPTGRMPTREILSKHNYIQYATKTYSNFLVRLSE